jgi:hypothetical protein
VVQAHLDGIPHSVIGSVTETAVLEVVGVSTPRESISVEALRAAWSTPTGG